jgi:hypothetical protein
MVILVYKREAMIQQQSNLGILYFLGHSCIHELKFIHTRKPTKFLSRMQEQTA